MTFTALGIDRRRRRRLTVFWKYFLVNFIILIFYFLFIPRRNQVMDVWTLAEQIQTVLYGTSVCWSFVYVCLKVSRACLHWRPQNLLIFAIAGSSFLYGFLKTLNSFIGDGTNHPDLITWLKNMEPRDYKVSE